MKEGTMLRIRYATVGDLPALTNIYNYYVAHTNISFSEVPKSVEQEAKRFKLYSETGPYRMWVAEEEGRIVGCAATNRYREHPAFRQTVEVSIYLAHDTRSRGIGSALYDRLFSEIDGTDLHRAFAGIALPNEASVSLHKKFGFEEVGIFDEYAVKNGQFISSIWLQKKLKTAVE